MSDKLKKCYFCGGEAELKRGLTNLDNFVKCKACGCSTKLFNTKKSAITAWNTRKPADECVEALEEYRGDFMSDIYEELREDTDNCRANRIIDRFDDAIQIVKEHLN